MGSKYLYWNFYAVLFINMTSLYFPLAKYTPLTLKALGVYFILSCFTIMFSNRRELGKLMGSPRMGVLFTLIVVVPFASLWITPVAQLRDVALIVLYFMLIAAVALAVRVRGWLSVWRVFQWALALNIVGVILSFFIPYQFLTAFSGDSHLYVLGQGRAPGLFVNGNQSSKVIILLMVAWIAIPKGLRVGWRYMLGFGAAFVAVLMTGSRSSLVIYLMFTASVWVHFLFETRGHKSFNAWKIYFIFLPLALPFFIAGLLLLIKLAAPFLSDDFARGDSLTARVEVFTSGPKAIYEEILKAGQERIEVTRPYIEGIAESPIIGHGIRSMFAERYYSGLELISHNTFVTLAYEFGLIYVLCFVTFFVSLFWLRYRREAEAHFGQSLMVYFITIVFLFYLTIGTGHELRPIWCVLGALLGLMVFNPYELMLRHYLPVRGGNSHPTGK